MLFNSLEYPFFLIIVFFIYWYVFRGKTKAQNGFILFVSYIFYGWWDWRFLSLIIFSSGIDYWVALKISRTGDSKKRRCWLGISLLVNLGLLCTFKYLNFFIESWLSLWASFGVNIHIQTLYIILPVGISFYTFQTLSYTIDVYRNKIAPSRDILVFFSYVSFFPQLVAGPIERAKHLLPQFQRPRYFSYEKGIDGLVQILWGLFKKVVIADNCAVYVNEIFSQYSSMGAAALALGAVLFAFQIYGDFSGYSDIAIGSAKLLGFDLMANFKYPYFSRDIAEFWRRWHVSLSTWFRDYVYFPLGGSRGKLQMTIRNIFIIFAVSGFWHGANWTFIIWGLLNAVYYLPLLLSERNRSHLGQVAEDRFLPSLSEIFSMITTFTLTCFAWIFFRSESLLHATSYILGYLRCSKV